MSGRFERWRSAAARRLVKTVRQAGGTVDRDHRGQLIISGPVGTVRIQEPADDSRRDLRRSSAEKLIVEGTGLKLGMPK